MNFLRENWPWIVGPIVVVATVAVVLYLVLEPSQEPEFIYPR